MFCFVTLARLVDLPTPFTPQKVMMKGLRWERASSTSLKMSTRRLGCRICTRESCRACFTVEATAGERPGEDLEEQNNPARPESRTEDKQVRGKALVWTGCSAAVCCTHWWKCPWLCLPVSWPQRHRAGRRFRLLHSWLEKQEKTNCS